MAYDPLSGLDETQDVLSRAGFGSDKRKRRQALSQAGNAPSSFTSDFAPQIQEAQQPSEFWGAGRKLASNQNVDKELTDYVGGNLSKLGNEYYYYGDTDFSQDQNVQDQILKGGYKKTGKAVDTSILPYMPDTLGDMTKFRDNYYYKGDFDPSNAQWGTEGYQTKDLGLGKWDVLDQTGTSMGTSYKGLNDVLSDYAYSRGLTKHDPVAAGTESYRINSDKPWMGTRQIAATPEQWSHNLLNTPEVYSDEGNTPAQIRKFNSEAELRAALQQAGHLSLDSKEKYGRSISDIQRWEELGQFINDPNKKGITDWTYHRNLGGNMKSDPITGLNTLYGSTPLIANGKIIGYRMDTTPANPNDPMYVNPYSQGSADTSGKTRSSTYMGRQYNDPESWSKLVSGAGGDNVFVGAEDAANLPGWKNYDSSSYSHESSGFIPKALKTVAPALQLASIFYPALRPFAMVAGAGNTIAQGGNPIPGLAMSGLGSYLSSIPGGGAGADFVGPPSSAAMGSGSALGGNIASAIGNVSAATGISAEALKSGGMSALSSLVNKQGGKGALTSGVLSGLSSLFGGQVGKLAEGMGASDPGSYNKLGQSAASFGLKELFNKRGLTGGEDVIKTLPAILNATSTQPEKQTPQRQSNLGMPNMYSMSAPSIQDLYKQQFLRGG